MPLEYHQGRAFEFIPHANKVNQMLQPQDKNTFWIFSLPVSMTRIIPLIPPATKNGMPSILHAQLKV